MSRNFFNPAAPQSIQMQGGAGPEPSVISPQERALYTIRILIVALCEFNLKTVDSRINHDKEWGKRDWAKGAPTATSCLIPAIYQREITDKLRRNPNVMHVCGEWEKVPSFEQAPARSTINPDGPYLDNPNAPRPPASMVEIKYTVVPGRDIDPTFHPLTKIIRQETGGVIVMSMPKHIEDKIMAELREHPTVTSINGEAISYHCNAIKVSESRHAAFPAPTTVEIRYTLNARGMADCIDPRTTYIREEAGRVAVISAPKDLADEIIAKLKAHPAVTSVNGVAIAERELQRSNTVAGM